MMVFHNKLQPCLSHLMLIHTPFMYLVCWMPRSFDADFNNVFVNLATTYI